MSAEGSQAAINIREEQVPGQLDPGQFTGINFVSETLEDKREHKRSGNVRPDRQTSKVRPINSGVEGGISCEFQAENLDTVLPGSIWADNWVASGTISNPVNFTTETGAGVGGIITFNVADTIDILEGQFISVNSPTANAANVGFFLVKNVDGQNVQVYSPLFTEIGIADVTLNSSRIVNGVTRHYYSIERALEDVSEFFLFLGNVPNALELMVEAEKEVEINQTFIGIKEEEPKNTQWGTTDPTPLSENDFMIAGIDVGDVLVDGEILSDCLVQKISFTFDNKLEGRKSVNFFGNCDVKGNPIELGGQVVLYFPNSDYYLKYKNSTSFGLAFVLQDSDGNKYGFHLLSNVFDAAKVNITDREEDVLFESDFMSQIGSAGYMISITRALSS